MYAELLRSTPTKGMVSHSDGLVSPRYDLQSPKIPLFHASPRRASTSVGNDAFRSPEMGTFRFPTTTLQSPLAHILADGHSRVSPQMAKAAAMKQVPTLPVVRPFSDLFHSQPVATPVGSPMTLIPEIIEEEPQSTPRQIRRRTLNFSSPMGSGDPLGLTSRVAQIPQSPLLGPPQLSIETLLPIPQLKDNASGSSEGAEGSAHDVTMSPSAVLRRRSSITDSPAVNTLTNAAVAAALEAAGKTPSNGRPHRAAARGAALAAAKAASFGTGPSQGPANAMAAAHIFGGIGVPQPIGNSNGIQSGSFEPNILGNSSSKKCNCKKSRCLKLYCDCFANGAFCGEGCSCVGCSNKVDNAEIVIAAREHIQSRNPNAFVRKIEEDVQIGAMHRRGCNCKKSKCLKKYCECFQAGIACAETCKCEGCHNTVEYQQNHPRAPPGKRSRSNFTDISANNSSKPMQISPALLQIQNRSGPPMVMVPVQAGMDGGSLQSEGWAPTQPGGHIAHITPIASLVGPAGAFRQQVAQEPQGVAVTALASLSPGDFSFPAPHVGGSAAKEEDKESDMKNRSADASDAVASSQSNGAGANKTPTKRKPARTMTAALM